jgi:hypothetical protein
VKTYKDLALEGLTDGLSSGRLGGRISIKEDLARDIEAGFKKLSSKKARAGKSDGFEGKSIKCGDFSITPVKYHDASDTTPGADENIAFHVYVEDGKGKAVTDKIGPSQGNDAIDFMEYGKFDSSDKKTAKEIEKWCNSNRMFDPKEEVAQVLEGYRVKDKGLQTALMIMRQIESTALWVDGWADSDPKKYEHSLGEGSVFPKENIIKFSKDLEKVMKKWTKAGSAWKNHGEPGGTDSIHIKN